MHLLDWLPKRKRRLPRAARTVAPGELFRGTPREAVVLPLLPDLGAGEGGIEFAAASVLERAVLGALVRQEQPRRIFEIGTFRGVTALTLAANAPQGATVWTLDLPPDLTAGDVAELHYGDQAESGFHQLARTGAARQVGAAFANYDGAVPIEQLFGDVAAFDFSPYSPLDFFFVDGCHAYDAARRDTEIALRLLRQGGLIVWHDYTWPCVERAANESCSAAIKWVSGTSIAFARKE